MINENEIIKRIEKTNILILFKSLLQKRKLPVHLRQRKIPLNTFTLSISIGHITKELHCKSSCSLFGKW